MFFGKSEQLLRQEYLAREMKRAAERMKQDDRARREMELLEQERHARIAASRLIDPR